MEPDKDSRIMRKCRCGWEKVTTFRGLRIHQGKKRCTARGQQKQCTATAGQTLGTKSQVSNHRAEGSNAADGRQEAEGPVVESSPLESGTENTPGTPTINNQQASQRREKKEPGRRQAIKWPKTNEPAVWQKLDNDVTVLLEHSLRGRVETRLNSLGDILYEECRSRFGVVAERRRAAPKQKGRREREIEQLVWRRRQLRKQWRKASQEEKEGLKPLWEEVRKSLSNLRRAERIRQRRRRKEKERSNFFKNPFKHAKQLLEDKRSGKLEITKSELEKHIREQYSDPAKAIPLGSPGYVPRPAPPVIPFNTAPPKLSEVADVVRKARAASAPGPNGVPYKLYKYCPGVRKILWKLLKVAWGKNIIPSEWQRAVTVFIPKEQNSNSISQFRSIALLNVEGKIFFSIMAKRLTSYLTKICPLCNTINASLQHILSGCKTALSQGRYRWRHDAVLKKLAEVAESCRREANSRPAAPARHTIQFARAGENINAPRPSNMGRLLSPGSEWNMKVDLGRQLQFPREIAETSLRPDMVLWSVASKTVLLVELTVPWEGGLETAHERKRAKYSDLAAECREAGWKATVCPVEVGCRGFVGSSTSRLLRDLGCTGAGHRRASKELAEEAEKGSFWLWLRRKDTSWGPCNI
ncbi:hypothetical protein SKAU_G00335430 [Synaphobranchus kaupii]|uniref:Reverse transcriptase n=1 Tax=Synaphobranchus kaupii TaxID=118154 RepID=A0A9Q1IIN2_SYNKA|nr:hypothetical protein SKAU_G00335430 [Synaphobranchus kaupii]